MAFEERSGPFDLSNHWTTSPRVRLTASCLAGLEHDHAARLDKVEAFAAWAFSAFSSAYAVPSALELSADATCLSLLSDCFPLLFVPSFVVVLVPCLSFLLFGVCSNI